MKIKTLFETEISLDLKNKRQFVSFIWK